MKIESITAPNPGTLTLDGTRTYLLGASAVLDPGPIIERHIDAIVAAVPRLEIILITHRHADHAPAALPLKQRTGARIFAPAGALPESSIDSVVAGGETITIDGETVEVIATPGHTSEHVCYLTANGDLFTGDTVLGEGTTAIFPPDGDMADYLRSLRLLRARKPARIYPAHGPVRHDADAVLGQYIEHRLERERQVLEALLEGPLSLPELRARIYPDLAARLRGAAEIQLSAHLIKLRAERRVEERDGHLFQRIS